MPELRLMQSRKGEMMPFLRTEIDFWAIHFELNGVAVLLKLAVVTLLNRASQQQQQQQHNRLFAVNCVS